MTAPESDRFIEALLSRGSESELFDLARRSSVCFVRSLDQLAEDSEAATGRRITAFEALAAYGKDVLVEVVSEGSALLCESPSAAGEALRARRTALGLDERQVAVRADIDERTVHEAEQSKRLNIRVYERIARAIGLDDRYISVHAGQADNGRLAVRLRALGIERQRMTPSAVSGIAEAAWVAATQVRLESQLGIPQPDVGITPNSNYGEYGYPAFMHGYFLANQARERLKLGDGALARPLREICEEMLGIPLIQAELGEHIAGVTVAIGGSRRAIVLNISGKNQRIEVRRATIAHELGHLLYDVDDRLQNLRVDEYEELDRPAEGMQDVVEQRANAFAVEFIAPQKAVEDCFRNAKMDPLSAVMETFGISFTVARYQVWNAFDRKIAFEEIDTQRRYSPPEKFVSGEDYTVAYHPLGSIRASRAGRFSAVVLRAAEEKIISRQTASEYLGCREEDLDAGAAGVRDLFPRVFERRR
jgi:Zn-dependent peptidase ImmA (M78 family)/transcriptional regulator with XRE-family HTH domain